MSFAGKFFGRKNSSVQASVLKRLVKPKKKVASNWVTRHRDKTSPFRKVTQGDLGVEQQQQLDSKLVDNMADVLASRIITQGISEHSGVNQTPRADKPNVSVMPVSDSSVHHKSGGFELTKEKRIEIGESHASEHGKDPSTSFDRDKFVSDIEGEERIEKMPVDSHHHGIYDVTNADPKQNEPVRAQQDPTTDGSTLEPSVSSYEQSEEKKDLVHEESGSQDPETELSTRVGLPVNGTASNTYNQSKRTSHFAQEDEEFMREKDKVIEKAIKFKLKQTKRGDMFKDWTEVEEESSDEQKPAPEKQKTFFAWRSLFSVKNKSATDSEDTKETKIVKIRPERIFTKVESPKQDLKRNLEVEGGMGSLSKDSNNSERTSAIFDSTVENSPEGMASADYKMSPNDRQKKSVRFLNQSHSKDDDGNINWSSSNHHFSPCVPECALCGTYLENNGTTSCGMIINIPDRQCFDRQDKQTCQCGLGLMDNMGSLDNGLTKPPSEEATCGYNTSDERSDRATCHCHNESPDRNWTHHIFARCGCCSTDVNPDGDACPNTISEETGGMNLDCRKPGQEQDDHKHHANKRRKDTSCHCFKFDSSGHNASCENSQIRCVQCTIAQCHYQNLNSGSTFVDSNKGLKPYWNPGNKDSLCDACVQMYDALNYKKLNNLDRNWSSSSRLSPRQMCWTCDMSGCVLHNCGLEKLVELQQACLTFHLKANSRLKAYITDKHQHVTQYQMLKATVSMTS